MSGNNVLLTQQVNERSISRAIEHAVAIRKKKQPRRGAAKLKFTLVSINIPQKLICHINLPYNLPI